MHWVAAILTALMLPLITHAVVQRVMRPRRADWQPPRRMLTPEPLAAVMRRPRMGAILIDRRIDLDKPANFPRRVRFLKRALDIVGSTLGLCLVAPLMMLVAIAVKIDSRGPILFRQERVRHMTTGQDVTFMMNKFRSMRQDAEKETGPVWAGKDDPRITNLGRFMRKTRLDELPQLFNVLKGDMSLVGPRPERPFFTEQLQQEIPAYQDRAVALKPGVTGWAQVSCDYDATLEDVRSKLLYDLAYAAHLYRLASYLRIEFRILARTVLVVLTGKGAR